LAALNYFNEKRKRMRIRRRFEFKDLDVKVCEKQMFELQKGIASAWMKQDLEEVLFLRYQLG
jgi:hypothetical protein